MTLRLLGLGNVLMGDDGAGPYVIEQVRAAFEAPDDVEIVDVGTPGLDLVPFLSDVEACVIVDTVRSAGAPGEMRVYRMDQILTHAPLPRLGPHEPGLKESLITLHLAGRAPREVVLIGVIPERSEAWPGLSPSVRDRVPELVAQVVEECARLGHPLLPRSQPLVPDTWWEVPADVEPSTHPS